MRQMTFNKNFERSLMVTEHINREQESILVEIEKLYKKVECCSVIKNVYTILNRTSDE